MRNRVGIAASVVVLVVAVLIGWRSCGGSGGTSSSGSQGSAAGTASASGSAGPRRRAQRGPVKPASIAGRVIKKADGTGIAGAVVSIDRAELIEEIMPSAEASLIVVTDAQGAFTLTPVLPGTYFLAATANGFIPGTRAKLVVDSGDAQTGIDLALDAGGTLLSGTVTDVGGGPIVDARITVQRENNFELSGKPDLVTVTKPDGTYQITLGEGEFETLASHDEYTSQGAHVEIAQTPVRRDFVLTPGAVVRGQVIARDSGKPVAGAWLLADASRGRGASKTARCDDAGNFVLRGLRSGAISLRAQGPSYASATPTVVELGIGEQLDGVRVLVDHAFTISGRVVRKGKADQGVPGVQLGMFSIATQQFGVALEPTDEEGAFVIHGVRPASYMLFAGGEGNVPEVGKSIDVIDKDVTDVVIEMSTGVTVTGRVEPPVAGARVSLALAGGVSLTSMFEAVKAALVHGETDAGGAFTLRNAPAGAFTLTAVATTGDTGTLAVVITEVDQSGLVVPLEARASISGRVVDDKGAAVAEASVRARKTDDGPSFSMTNDDLSGTTRPDGSFKIVGLEEGAYTMSVRDADRGQAIKFKDGKPPKVTLAKAQQITNLVLTVEARDGVIRGVVIGADRKPVADAWVTAERSRPDFSKMSKEDFKNSDTEIEVINDFDFPTKPVLTGADGRFTIERLRRGTYTLSAEGPRGASRGEAKDIKTGSSATITLRSLGTLSGKVTGADGKLVTAYEISCDGPDDEDDTRSIAAADGAYSIDRLTPGNYKCVVMGDAGSGEGSVDVPSGAATLDITLERWASITGRVVDVLTKKPVPGMMVMVTSTSGNNGGKYFEDMLRGRSPKTDANGVFVVDRVAAGSGALTVMGAELSFTGESLASKPYTATKGQRLDLGTIEIVSPRVGDAGTYGFATTITDDKLIVSSVKADGPAALAGVREQDRIVALGGMPVDALKPDVAQRILASGTVGVGIPVTLTLDRAGTPVEVALVSVKW